MNLAPLAQLSQTHPEKYGLMPRQWGATPSVAEHVMGNHSSSYVLSNSNFPEGSPCFDGRSVFIDIAKAKAAGARLVSTDEIIASLQDYKAKNPHLSKRIDKIAKYVEDIDKEVLVHGEKNSRKGGLQRQLDRCRSDQAGGRLGRSCGGI